ncbi:MAG: carboxypeptidase-like regulatory domain-containing protein [Bacteroidota bacterium]
MAEQIKSDFGGLSNDSMLTGAETMLDLYTDDQADFLAFDASLDDGFKDNFLAKIDEARALRTDETVVDEISEFTDDVNESWDSCKNHFQDSKYFIEKAFPNDTSLHKTFGYDDYKAMSRDQDKVIGFMDQFHTAADEHKVELIAQGYTQGKIDAIQTLSGAYREAQRLQEKAKKVRFKKTEQRVITMNEVWGFVRTINKASKSVYRTSFAKLQMYLLPGSGTNEPVEQLAGTGTITDSVTGLPLAGALVELTDLALSSVADDNGKYAFTVGVPDGATAIKVTAAGHIRQDDTITFIDGDTVTKNFSMVPG